MDQVLCTTHGAPCMMKTGTKPGPNLGKCFYMCSVLRDKCDFVQPAKNMTSSACLKHPENIADLQYITVGKVSGEKRHYYKCSKGVEKGQNWCGYVVIEMVGKVMPLGTSQKVNTNSTTVTIAPAGAVKHSVASSELKISSSSNKAADKRLSDYCLSQTDPYSEKSADNKTEKSNRVDSSQGGLSQSNSSDTKTSSGTGLTIPEVITIADEDTNDFHTLANRIRNKSGVSPEEIGITTASSANGARPKITSTSKDSHNAMANGSKSFTSYREINLSSGGGNSLRDEISRELKQKKQIMGTVSLSSLPDNGERLRQDVVSLEQQLSQLNIQLINNQPTPSTDSVDYDHSPDNDPASVTSTAPLSKEKSAAKQSSNEQFNPEEDLATREVISKELKDIKQVMRAVVMSSLPDKGERLKKQAVDLEKQLLYLNQKLINNAHAKKSGSQQSSKSYSQQSHSAKQPRPKPPHPQVYTVYPNDPGASGQPKTTHIPHQNSAKGKSGIFPTGQPPGSMKQLTIPFKTVAGAAVNGEKQMIMLSQPENVPDHVLKQMYGARPQMMTLYGGRMTADRHREVGLVTRDAIEDLHKQMERRPADTEELEDPNGLEVPLMTHQRQALVWLTWREKQRPSGGILADDMGLGKTLTMISLIMKQNELNPQSKHKKSSRKSGQGDQEWLSKDKQLEKIDKNIVKSRATLIICPASLIHQWKKEIEKRCKPGVIENVILYHGPSREPSVLKLADNDVVLTTYNIVSKEVGEDADAKEAEKPVGDQEFLKGKKAKDMPNLLKIAWERLILDEAHNIKNHKCKTAISVCRLRAGSRWALTGTPIQNDLIDMYSLLRFLRCSPFDEFQVWKRQVAMNAGTGKARLNTLIKSILLRRTKDQKGKEGKPLVPLPKKSIVLHQLKLSKEEKTVYDKVYSQSQSAFKEYLKRHAEKNGDDTIGVYRGSNSSLDSSISSGAKGAAKGKGGGQKGPGATHILVSLLRLRQCCGHLSLLQHAIEDDVLETEGIELSLEEQMRGLMLNDSGSAKSKTAKSAVSQFDISKASSKIKAILEELQAIKKKSSKGNPLKSVVVSQWTKMLEIAGHHLDKAGFRCSIIQGNIPPHKRMEVVEDFNNNLDGPTVLLLSLRAGGVGLNLVGGSSLFLLDQHWNPALEEQACDRIYRVGQKNDVFIHKFLCTDTVEEKIAELQKRKTDLANDILSGSNASKRKLTLADLRMLFGV